MLSIKRSNHKKALYIILSAGAVVVVVAASVFAYRQASTDQESSDNSKSSNQENSVGAPRRSDNESQVGTEQAGPEAPKLIKSSGNVGYVPNGAAMQFTCEGTAGLSCEIIIKSTQEGVADEVLPAQKIEDDGRSLSFTTFDWIATPGTWNVSARVTDASGKTATSDSQTLMVKE